MNKRSMGAVLALVLLAGMAASVHAREADVLSDSHGPTETVLTMRARGDLTFGPDGAVKEYRIATTLDPKTAEYVGRAIGKLKFHPYLRDGVPVNVKTYFQVTLAARPNGADSYELSIDHLIFDDKAFPSRKELAQESEGAKTCVTNCIRWQPRLPYLPKEMMVSGVSGQVMVHLYLNPDGTIADAAIAQSALYGANGRDGRVAHALRLFETDVLRFARDLKAAPGSGSQLAGDAHLVASLPVIFGGDFDNEGAWRLEHRTARNIASWLVHDPDRWIGVSDTSGSGLVAMKDSPYKLISEETHTP